MALNSTPAFNPDVEVENDDFVNLLDEFPHILTKEDFPPEICLVCQSFRSHNLKLLLPDKGKEIIEDRLDWLIEKGSITLEQASNIRIVLENGPCFVIREFYKEVASKQFEKDVQSMIEIIISTYSFDNERLADFASEFTLKIREKINAKEKPGDLEIAEMKILTFANKACTIPKIIIQNLLWAIYYLKEDEVKEFLFNLKEDSGDTTFFDNEEP